MNKTVYYVSTDGVRVLQPMEFKELFKQTELMIEAWLEGHQGNGHGDCTIESGSGDALKRTVRCRCGVSAQILFHPSPDGRKITATLLNTVQHS